MQMPQNLTLIHIKWLGIGNQDLSLLFNIFSCNSFSQMACVFRLTGKLNIIPCQQSSGWFHGLYILWGLNLRLTRLSLNWIWQPKPEELNISLLWAGGFGSLAKLEFGTCFSHSKPQPSQGQLSSGWSDLHWCDSCYLLVIGNDCKSGISSPPSEMTLVESCLKCLLLIDQPWHEILSAPGVLGSACLHVYTERSFLIHWTQTSGPDVQDCCTRWEADLQGGKGRKTRIKTWK